MTWSFPRVGRRSGLAHVLFLALAVGLGPATAEARPQRDTIEEQIDALDSVDEAVRDAAIEALAKAGDRAEEPLRKVLLSPQSSPRSRSGVIEVWGRMKRKGTKRLEAELLRGQTAAILRKLQVLSAIAELGPKAAWTEPTLIKLAESKPEGGFEDAHRLLRTSVIMTLGRLGGTSKKVRGLLQAQMKDDSLEVRVSAACALWWTGSEPDEVVPTFEEGLEAREQIVQERAIFGLGEMGPRAESHLERLLELGTTVKPETKIVIEEATGKIRGLVPPVGPRPFPEK